MSDYEAKKAAIESGDGVFVEGHSAPVTTVAELDRLMKGDSAAEAKPLGKMTVPQLREEAARLGIQVDENAKKADILTLIQEAEQGQGDGSE